MSLEIIKGKERKKILNLLNQQFEISEIPGTLLKRGKQRLFLFQGDVNEQELKKIEKCAWIERAGVYFGKEEKEGIRLSIEGSQILGRQIKKNIFELDKEMAEKWMSGQELPIKTGKKGFLVIKCGQDFLGTGKASENKIGNFIPKSRRLKNKEKI